MSKKRLLFSLIVVCLPSLVQGQFRRKSPSPVSPSQETLLDYANPSEYTISKISVRGLNVLDENAVVSLTGLRVGDKIRLPGEQISSAIRKLWKHGLIGDVSVVVDKIEGQNVELAIALAERPRLSNFYFTGVTQGQESNLREELSLIRGKIVNDVMIKNTEVRVKKFFTKKGYLNVAVRIVEELDTISQSRVRIRIDVDKKARVRIRRIALTGNKGVGSTALKRQMKDTREYARFAIHRVLWVALADLFKKQRPSRGYDSLRGWARTRELVRQNVKLNIFASSKLIQSSFEDDKKNLIAYYNTKGYRDASIRYDTVVHNSDNTIDIRLHVDEGQKYYFRNITWVGNYVHNDAMLNTILAIRKGDVYNQQLIEKRITYNPKGADISSLYMDDGYLFFRITPTEVAVDGDSIDIEMRLFEGEQATIRDVAITGNERTNDHVIRRELRTVPGQKFSRSDVIRTQQQLSQLGFFNPQAIEPDIRPNPATGTVDIGWKLEEQSNDQVQLSGGWGGAFGFVGTVGVTFNNFSLRNITNLERWSPLPTGDGQRFSLSVQANGLAYQNYRVAFTEPWLGGRKPNSFSVNYNHSVSRRTTGFFQVDNDMLLRQNGFTVGLGRRLEWPDSYFTLLNSLSILVYDYKGDYFGSSIFPVEGRTTNIKLETVLSRNSIDNPIFPTRGANLSLSLSLAPPYSVLAPDYFSSTDRQFEWVEMHKWMFDAKLYFKLAGGKKPNSRSLVLQAKTHFGFIGRYDRSRSQGPFDRFLLGGDGLAGGFNSFVLGQDVIGLRGYENNAITPPLYSARGRFLSSSVEGGVAFAKLGAELRYPVVTGQTATIYTLLFAEGGNNWGNLEDFDPFQLYKSAGAGLQLFMPAFGWIGLHWAYGFDTLPNSLTPGGAQFHFIFGQQIR